MIELKDALRDIDRKGYRDQNGSFSITFMTCDVNRHKGGEMISLSNACGCGLPPDSQGQEKRGIKDMDTGRPYVVHNRLIFEYNGKPIYWV